MTKNQQTDALIPIGGEQPPALYARMQTAIAACYGIDDCKQIATQAAAIAAYYKQIKDDESVRKFLQIKIRAWRRIGEILTGANIDKSACNTLGGGAFNFAEYIRRIRAAFDGRAEVEELSDAGIRQALRLAEIPRDFFDQQARKLASIEALLGEFAALQRREWEASPDGKARLRTLKELEKVRKQEAEKYEQEAAKRRHEGVKAALEQAKRQQEEAADLEELKTARDKAFDEVGITLERRDREQMHQIVFLLKKSVHEILRQAAFDNRMTMQSILRSGLMMWFIAHGYNVPHDDMKLPNRKDRAQQRGHEM